MVSMQYTAHLGINLGGLTGDGSESEQETWGPGAAVLPPAST